MSENEREREREMKKCIDPFEVIFIGGEEKEMERNGEERESTQVLQNYLFIMPPYGLLLLQKGRKNRLRFFSFSSPFLGHSIHSIILFFFPCSLLFSRFPLTKFLSPSTSSFSSSNLDESNLNEKTFFLLSISLSIFR